MTPLERTSPASAEDENTRRVHRRFRIYVVLLFMVAVALATFVPGIEHLQSRVLLALGLQFGAVLGWGICSRAVAAKEAVRPPTDADALQARIHELEGQIESIKERILVREEEWANIVTDVQARAVGNLSESFGISLRNFLSFTETLAGILIEKQINDPQLRKWIERLRVELEPVETVWEATLAMSSSRENRTTSFDLNALVVRAVGLVSTRFRGQGIQLEVDLSPKVTRVLGNPFDAAVCVLTALDNSSLAVAGRRQPRIAVSTRIEDGRSVITIQDTRPVARDKQNRFFSPDFLKEEPELSGRHSYLPLRLLAQRTQFGVDIKSDEGKNTTTVRLLFTPADERAEDPSSFAMSGEKLEEAVSRLQRAAAPASPAAEEAATGPVLAGTRILLVEPDPELAAQAGGVLESEGAEVVHASDITATRQKIAEGVKYDLLVVDYRLPGLDPDAMVENLVHRKSELAHRLIFTARDTGDDEIRQFLAEFQYPFLDKPFDKNVLLDTVRVALASLKD